ncbi:hypothetical protein [Desulfomicrobium orale]|uniref:Uncharacterized protein n=1 Tax=Desulfomicrobium orale DSM 12838 TaxID=888061 RepID=A0A0X8JPJ5_9BACT|nr:hypothetical protein [Desulfomicrobium orale]AMD92497.1 hypothetical protein AXF15_04810 [Desulfomicrobium orale DSM 12838]
MSQIIEFLTPRMVGRRFDEHAIPLELLKDLAVLGEMLIEVAKWCYLRDHPERKRSPRGFTDGVALKLSGVGEGSAAPRLSLVVEQPQLFSFFPFRPQAQTYFEQARTHLIGAINAAEHNEPVTQHLPEELLAYFDRIGRGLRDDEAIEFAPQEADRKARLTRVTRRKLVLTSSQMQELTEEVILRGSIPEADQGKMTFELQVINGPRVTAPIAGQHLLTVMEAFNGYKQGARVLLQGIGRYSRYDRLQSLETVEHLSLLDSNDIAARVEELKSLRHGWLDGKQGFAPDKAGLDWLAETFQRNYPDELPQPYLYPTAEGGVQAEWSLNDWEISLEVDFERHQGQWHALNMSNEQEEERTLNLNEPADWQWLSKEITERTGVTRE